MKRVVKRLEDEIQINEDEIVTYKEQPDLKSGRCDKCDSSQFKSKVGGGKFYRTCRECGYTKLV